MLYVACRVVGAPSHIRLVLSSCGEYLAGGEDSERYSVSMVNHTAVLGERQRFCSQLERCFITMLCAIIAGKFVVESEEGE